MSVRERRLREDGLTLLEVLMACVVLAVVALALYLSLASGLAVTRSTGDAATATFECEQAMEEVLTTPFDDLSTTYPQGQAIAAYDNRVLKQERIAVSYNDGGALGAAGSVTSPVEIALTVTWVDTQGAPRAYRLSTARAR